MYSKRTVRAIQEKVGAMKIEKFVLDYERASCAAIREVWPTIDIKGRLFHFTQVIFIFILVYFINHI